MPLKQLTDLIGIDRSSVLRLANTLRQRRFLAHQKGSKDFILGLTAWRLSRRYRRNVLGTFLHHFLQELTVTLGETSHFAVREGSRCAINQRSNEHCPRRTGEESKNRGSCDLPHSTRQDFEHNGVGDAR